MFDVCLLRMTSGQGFFFLFLDLGKLIRKSECSILKLYKPLGTIINHNKSQITVFEIILWMSWKPTPTPNPLEVTLWVLTRSHILVVWVELSTSTSDLYVHSIRGAWSQQLTQKAVHLDIDHSTQGLSSLVLSS